MNEIKLIQAPVIQHTLVVVGQSVTDRIKELNLENQVATEDTIQTIKTLRADLNKELTAYEDQRKAVKKAVNDPYTEFEDIYKSEIAEKYKTAIDLLKDKISVFEDKIKSDKKIVIMEYFVELCLSENIDFLNFGNTGLKIDLSTSEKKYKESCNDFVNRVKDDLGLIDTQNYKAEILVEYKKELNASRAIKTIQERKEAEKREADRIKDTETERRCTMLRNMAMVRDDITRTFYFNDAIYIQVFDIENFSLETFQTEYLRLKAEIEKELAALNPVTTPASIKAPTAQLKANASKVEPEKVFTARFECSVTMAQATALKSFLLENDITYKNI